MQNFSTMTGVTVPPVGLVVMGDAVAAAGSRVAHRPIGPDRVG